MTSNVFDKNKYCLALLSILFFTLAIQLPKEAFSNYDPETNSMSWSEPAVQITEENYTFLSGFSGQIGTLHGMSDRHLDELSANLPYLAKLGGGSIPGGLSDDELCGSQYHDDPQFFDLGGGMVLSSCKVDIAHGSYATYNVNTRVYSADTGWGDVQAMDPDDNYSMNSINYYDLGAGLALAAWKKAVGHGSYATFNHLNRILDLNVSSLEWSEYQAMDPDDNYISNTMRFFDLGNGVIIASWAKAVGHGSYSTYNVLDRTLDINSSDLAWSDWQAMDPDDSYILDTMRYYDLGSDFVLGVWEKTVGHGSYATYNLSTRILDVNSSDLMWSDFQNMDPDDSYIRNTANFYDLGDGFVLAFWEKTVGHGSYATYNVLTRIMEVDSSGPEWGDFQAMDPDDNYIRFTIAFSDLENGLFMAHWEKSVGLGSYATYNHENRILNIGSSEPAWSASQRMDPDDNYRRWSMVYFDLGYDLILASWAKAVGHGNYATYNHLTRMFNLGSPELGWSDYQAMDPDDWYVLNTRIFVKVTGIDIEDGTVVHAIQCAWKNDIQGYLSRHLLLLLPEEPEPGDLNNDGCVDIGDLNLLLNIIRRLAEPDPNIDYDLNDDGVVNVSDARTLVTLFDNPRGAPCQ